MAQYKSVAGPKAFGIKKWEDLQEQVSVYGEIISREAVGGWEFVGVYPIQINKKVGLFAGMMRGGSLTGALLGGGFDPDIFESSMLLFKKD